MRLLRLPLTLPGLIASFLISGCDNPEPLTGSKGKSPIGENAANHSFISSLISHDPLRCERQVKGTYDFGRAPNGCDIENYIQRTSARLVYAPLILDERSLDAKERDRYVNTLHSVLRDAATYYLRKRKPGVSAAEIQAWRIGIMATAFQESYWSHYRYAKQDGRLKFVRGDNLHGHGLMQIDDRIHRKFILSGQALDLVRNLTYGLDIYFLGWERALRSGCVRSPTDWIARARSAYAFYNSGHDLCRWTNPAAKFAKNDQFQARWLAERPWERAVTDPSQRAPFVVECAMQGVNCGQPVAMAPTLETLPPKLTQANARNRHAILSRTREIFRAA